VANLSYVTTLSLGQIWDDLFRHLPYSTEKSYNIPLRMSFFKITLATKIDKHNDKLALKYCSLFQAPPRVIGCSSFSRIATKVWRQRQFRCQHGRV